MIPLIRAIRWSTDPSSPLWRTNARRIAIRGRQLKQRKDYVVDEWVHLPCGLCRRVNLRPGRRPPTRP